METSILWKILRGLENHDFSNFQHFLKESLRSSQRLQNDWYFWGSRCTFDAISEPVLHILANPRSCRCKKAWKTRMWYPLTFWRPVEPAFADPSRIWTKIPFFPLFLAHVEISTKFSTKSLDVIIFHLQLRGFVKIMPTGCCGSASTFRFLINRNEPT